MDVDEFEVFARRSTTMQSKIGPSDYKHCTDVHSSLHRGTAVPRAQVRIHSSLVLGRHPRVN